MARQDNADDPGILFLGSLQQRHAVHFRHAHVGYQDIDIANREALQCLPAALDEHHLPLPALTMKTRPETFQDVQFIIDEQDCFLAHLTASLCSGCLPSMGSSTVNVVPSPCLDRNVSVPPCLSTTTDLAIASPCQYPCPLVWS